MSCIFCKEKKDIKQNKACQECYRSYTKARLIEEFTKSFYPASEYNKYIFTELNIIFAGPPVSELAKSASKGHPSAILGVQKIEPYYWDFIKHHLFDLYSL
jgi:hypothetical protein